MFRINAQATDIEPKQRKALVTILVGDEYHQTWNVISRPNWEAYAQRHGFDLIVIEDYLDGSDFGRSRSVAWQKLLILNQPWSRRYERIVWVDADIIISRFAPDITRSVPDADRIGIVDGSQQFSAAEMHIYYEIELKVRVSPKQADRLLTFNLHNGFALDGLEVFGAPMFSTGVMVLTPERHNDLLLRTYPFENRSRMYEQGYLTREIHRDQVAEIISPRFNWGVHQRLVLDFAPDFGADLEEKGRVLLHLRNELARKAYFLHFAGAMPLLHQIAGTTARGNDILRAL